MACLLPDASTVKRLQRHGLRTVGDLVRIGADIAEHRLLGTRTLERIDAALQPVLRYVGSGPALPGDAGPVVAQDLMARGLADVRDMADFSTLPWFDGPLPPRAAAALALCRTRLDALSLGDTARTRLGAAPALLAPARLLLASRDDMRELGIGPGSAMSSAFASLGRELHDALRRAAADRLTGLQQEQPIVELLAQLASRSDLAELEVRLAPWPEELCQALEDADCRQLGCAFALGAQTILEATNPGGAHRTQLRAALEATLALPGSAAGVDWATVWREAGVRVIPEGFVGDAGTPIGWAAHEAMRDIALAWLDETDWQILQQRYGLLGSPVLRLQQIGDAMGVTRQRVQQREARAVRRLGQLLLGSRTPRDWPREGRLHPDLAALFERLNSVLDRVSREFMHHEDLQRLTDPLLERTGPALDPLVRLMADARGLEHLSVDADDAARIWLPHDAAGAQAADLERTVRRIHRFLTRTSNQAFTEAELTDRLNDEATAGERLRVSEVVSAARLCSSVERTRFGELRGRTGWLARRDDALERLLADAGQPVHIGTLVRELNASYAEAGRRPISLVTAGNYLSRSSRIAPIGKSGYWALQAWKHVETGTILDLMERCLAEHSRPMTAEEIYAHVSGLRPVREASIVSYLSSDPRFAKLDRLSYGLAVWPEAAAISRWNKRGMATFVARLFSDRETDRLPYREVAAAVEAASGLRRQSVRGMLAANPVIRTASEPGGVLMAILQTDFELHLTEGRRPQPRPGTLAAAVADRVRAILAEQPDHAMALADLRARILRELATTKGTFYSYVDNMPDVEKTSEPGSRRMLVRLVSSSPGRHMEPDRRVHSPHQGADR